MPRRIINRSAPAIEQAIYVLRGQRVMMDDDLAKLYGVPTKRLNEQVKRNLSRFPDDFMFTLTDDEVTAMRSQNATASRRNVRHVPHAFTEQGVAMLASVLSSPRAVAVNIEIVRAFVRLRNFLANNADLARRLDSLQSTYDEQFRVVFEAIRQLMTEPEPPAPAPMGFEIT